MLLAFRFVLAVLIAATLVSCFGRVFSDFDAPPQNDWHDVMQGLAVWLAAVLIAFLNELLLRRRNRSQSH